MESVTNSEKHLAFFYVSGTFGGSFNRRSPLKEPSPNFEYNNLNFLIFLGVFRGRLGHHMSRHYLRIFTLFSAAKAAQGMQMSVSQSVSLSVSQSVRNAYLFIRFTSIFYDSKSDKNETGNL